jgi:hypothetical protein
VTGGKRKLGDIADTQNTDASRGVKLTAHLHLVPRLRMRGAIPALPQFVFMAWRLVKRRDNSPYLAVSSNLSVLRTVLDVHSLMATLMEIRCVKYCNEPSCHVGLA